MILREPPAMWTSENRARYDRGGLRYPSDLTDEEWKADQRCIPPAKRGGQQGDADEDQNPALHPSATSFATP